MQQKGEASQLQFVQIVSIQSILPHAGNKWVRGYESKIEESKKAGSHRESNPGHLA